MSTFCVEFQAELIRCFLIFFRFYFVYIKFFRLVIFTFYLVCMLAGVILMSQ